MGRRVFKKSQKQRKREQIVVGEAWAMMFLRSRGAEEEAMGVSHGTPGLRGVLKEGGMMGEAERSGLREERALPLLKKVGICPAMGYSSSMVKMSSLLFLGLIVGDWVGDGTSL